MISGMRQTPARLLLWRCCRWTGPAPSPARRRRGHDARARSESRPALEAPVAEPGPRGAPPPCQPTDARSLGYTSDTDSTSWPPPGDVGWAQLRPPWGAMEMRPLLQLQDRGHYASTAWPRPSTAGCTSSPSGRGTATPSTPSPTGAVGPPTRTFVVDARGRILHQGSWTGYTAEELVAIPPASRHGRRRSCRVIAPAADVVAIGIRHTGGICPRQTGHCRGPAWVRSTRPGPTARGCGGLKGADPCRTCSRPHLIAS
jgi:hypothetical protein